MNIVEPDFSRRSRCGIPEIIFGESKSKEDLMQITEKFLSADNRAILTKVNLEKADYIKEKIGDEYTFSHNEKANLLVVKTKDFKINESGCVGIITAGTSDIPIAEESRMLLGELGVKTITSYDVGVAGVHRLFPALENMSDAQAIIVIAGMEGALPSVVSGLVDVPVIGVPTSIGYGVGKGGKTALFSMLTSCTPVAVVNIDNGYGAAILSYQIVRDRK